ncbi:hypothetical protein [Bradyrhizobium sp. SZCCHNR3015]|uniref:hypothetical protein n=1 Tax=Bradyrhizobium sp. SZCCHNR3015 TaxID=3057395 RepID=UPI00291664CC|nr:hypothetical protein [Bradyrhizobium sp. SZCCHNR3015]
MKIEDMGTFSDALSYMEQHGIGPDDAKKLALQIFNWGIGAALDRMRPSRPSPVDLPEVPGEQLSLIQETAAPKPKKAAAPKKAPHRIPQDFVKDEDMTCFARERGFTIGEIESMWLKFFNHYAANGETAVDWRAKWRTWVMRGVDYKARDNRGPGGRDPNKIDDRL